MTLVSVKRSAIVSSILLWDLGSGLAYWITLRAHQEYTSFDLRLLTAECMVTAAGDAALFAWAVIRAVRGRRPSWFLAAFTALGAAANAVAAYAWSLQPCPNRAPWMCSG